MQGKPHDRKTQGHTVRAGAGRAFARHGRYLDFRCFLELARHPSLGRCPRRGPNCSGGGGRSNVEHRAPVPNSFHNFQLGPFPELQVGAISFELPLNGAYKFIGDKLRLDPGSAFFSRRSGRKRRMPDQSGMTNWRYLRFPSHCSIASTIRSEAWPSPNGKAGRDMRA